MGAMELHVLYVLYTQERQDKMSATVRGPRSATHILHVLPKFIHHLHFVLCEEGHVMFNEGAVLGYTSAITN